MFHITYQDALAKANALKEVGLTTIYLDREMDDYPWDKVVRVEEGSSWRLNMPTSAWMIAEDQGLEFKWSFDFESREANGRGVALFDRAAMRACMRKLPAEARIAFANLLERSALQALRDRTRELEAALGNQLDSQECLVGLIAFAREPLHAAEKDA